MIVDSTALPEQAVQANVESAFQSAGQRNPWALKDKLVSGGRP
jgi:delta 1-pyrroline-5-carboxylate dehydrogenase